ncbi:PilZ domain-containing protein [Viridibacillus sp. YIM B01967]|uniref:PilZ domain-containing protein n=1 Tax=Viridibacillus soli TaxID=2798301 RepID=A0ABS1H758_9BACL|nr:PilZ domain-containing protein [Viridibacillus soli]MBK3494853.1 PilZ domain-containing protein [Viridibacillus soli]
MKYNRLESFRHILQEPVKADFRLCMDGKEQGKLSSKVECLILDLSPSGVKISTPINLPAEHYLIRMELTFVLYSKPIRAMGDVKWKRLEHGSVLYGVDLDKDNAVEEMIISELKARRRIEVKSKKAASEG